MSEAFLIGVAIMLAILWAVSAGAVLLFGPVVGVPVGILSGGALWVGVCEWAIRRKRRRGGG